jgi:hypothetical protein
MPIRINLLAEAVAEEELRRRDPVKRAIYGGAFLVALSLVWFSSTWLEYMVDKQTLNRVQGEIQTHTNDFAQVQGNHKKFTDVQKHLDSLDQLAAARFLQGNLMNALQQIYVPNVQLSHLRVDQYYTTIGALAPKTNNGVVLPGRPPIVTEHITLQMDAKDVNPGSSGQFDRFKDAIFSLDYFKNCLQTNGVRLTGLSPVQTPLDGKAYQMFSLECRFNDRNP